MTDQKAITQALAVAATFDVEREARDRIDFLSTYRRASGLKGYVLGISGGVDSLTAGLLAQRAVEALRAEGYGASFVAVRLPYGLQADENDAQRAVEIIRADRLLRVDIKPASLTPRSRERRCRRKSLRMSCGPEAGRSSWPPTAAP